MKQTTTTPHRPLQGPALATALADAERLAGGVKVRQFKVTGWFEEVMRMSEAGWKLAGKREIKSPPRGQLGVASEREFTITAPLLLYKGCSEPVTLKASPSRPVQIKTRCYPICGPLET